MPTDTTNGTKIDWGYIAGYFDGEGSAGLYRDKNGHETWGISFHNSHQGSLEAIQKFLGAGSIQQRAGTNKPMYILQVRRINELQEIIPQLLVRCIVKHDALFNLQSQIAQRKPAKNHGLLGKIGIAEILRLYEKEKWSSQRIAQKYGVTFTSVLNFLRKKKQKVRTRKEGTRLFLPQWGRLVELGDEWIRCRYWDQQMSIGQIAKESGVGRRGVYLYMERRNIPRRERMEAIRLAYSKQKSREGNIHAEFRG
jgi:predicted DNA-binding protein YlxM (UPF0122 family)